MQWSGNAREGVALVNRPFRGRRPGGCIKFYRDVRKHAGIAAVTGKRERICRWLLRCDRPARVFRCYQRGCRGEVRALVRRLQHPRQRWCGSTMPRGVESGEKSTARMSSRSTQCVRTFSNIFASHTNAWLLNVPPVIHRPSCATAGHNTSRASMIVPISFPSVTRHTPTLNCPSPPPTMCSGPSAVNSTAFISSPTSMSICAEPSRPTVANAASPVTTGSAS